VRLVYPAPEDWDRRAELPRHVDHWLSCSSFCSIAAWSSSSMKGVQHATPSAEGYEVVQARLS
jgi:hypothetical protein